jgi:hypothetical protein
MTPEIEQQLKSLEERHKAHQQMLEDHREARHLRRERHRRRWHKFKILPIALI